jgi:hypothetical protein
MKRVVLLVALALVSTGVWSDVDPSYSGSWYNPQENGHGLSVEIGKVGDTPTAVVYWYTFTDAGDDMFLVGTGSAED